MKEGRTIELLAPAKNLECGIEAIKHGADAVYIGAGRFGARQAAGNSVDDITELARFAHFYGARVYVTVNTILKDSELADAEKLIWQLYEAGADALLIQDMAVLRMKLPPIALHASTQCDVRSADKVRFLAGCGFTRVVLARELSIDEIRSIHEACPDVELECFVHGALCVSYSGQCYASQYCFGRSANRGECAQFCRLKFDLTDSDDNVIIKGKHLLSLRDMNRMDSLEELMDAGVCSFKIEGRLKDVQYVKNVTAAYSQAIDKVLVRRHEFVRASSGHSVAHFTPDVSRSFNRGLTDYFLHGRTDDIYSFGTPKSIGEKMGPVKEVGRGWLKVSGFKAFHNGDGLCFFNRQGELEGYRVVDILFREIQSGYEVVMTDEDGYKARAETEWKKEDARTPQEDNIRTQLSKLGGTRFDATDVEIQMEGERFIPSSLLSDLRRSVTDKLESLRLESYSRPLAGTPSTPQYPVNELSYLGNVMNAQARTFYQDHGVKTVDDAFEKSQPDSATVMFCRHCIKYALGICTKNRKRDLKIQEPLFLTSQDGRQFRLKFDCSRCQMEIMYQ